MQNLRSFVDLVLIQILILVLQLGLAAGYMAAIHLPLTLACLCTTPLLWLGAVWFSRVVRPAYVQNRVLVDHLIDVLSENVQGAVVVKGFAAEQQQIEKFAAANDAVRDQQSWIFLALEHVHSRAGSVEPGQPGRPAWVRRLAGVARPIAAGVRADRFRRAIATVF